MVTVYFVCLTFATFHSHSFHTSVQGSKFRNDPSVLAVKFAILSSATCARCRPHPPPCGKLHGPNHQLGTAGTDSGVPVQVSPVCLLQGLLAAQPTGRPAALLWEGFHHGTGFLPVLLYRLARWSALSSGHWALLVCLVQVRQTFKHSFIRFRASVVFLHT